MIKQIEEAIKTTLVVENKESIHYAVEKILLLLDVSVAVAFADWINRNDYEKIHGNRWCKKYMSVTHSTKELYEIWLATER